MDIDGVFSVTAIGGAQYPGMLALLETKFNKVTKATYFHMSSSSFGYTAHTTVPAAKP